MLTRRAFLHAAAMSAASLSGLPSMRLNASEPGSVPSKFARTFIQGTPRERGRLYGKLFKDGIHSFLEKEIYGAFVGQPSTKEELLRYAGACAKAVGSFCPIIHEELEGMADTSDLRLEELVLITLHEELYHRTPLPRMPHCTAAAAGPPDTAGESYVGQTWDWMASVAGLSSILHWKRTEGPSLLAYAFPGLWVGAGLNSAGLALCWTSADLGKGGTPRVGIPSYILLTHLLYQESLKAVAEEAKRATNAGWFTFVMGDAKGNLLNVEGSPKELAVEHHQGQLARIGYGSRQMTKTAPGEKVRFEGRCKKMQELLARSVGAIDDASFRGWFEDPKQGISERSTIDMMVFNTTKRTAHLSRGPGYGVAWQKLGFDDLG